MENFALDSADENTLPPPASGIGTHPTLDPSPHAVNVWLVDDNAQIRSIVSEALSLEAGIHCARLFESPDALLSELASKAGPDVILLDIQMGDRNGLDAVRPIRSLTRATHVLMFSTADNPLWRQRALQDGATDYLLKSCPIDKVAERIRTAARDGVPRLHRRRIHPKPQARTHPHPYQAARVHVAPGPEPKRHAPLLSQTIKFLKLFSN